MNTIHLHEKYPAKIVVATNLFTISIYGIGFAILMQVGLLYSMIYLAYILALEYRLLRFHCVNCFYYGKTCAFGKGKVSSMLFRQGDISRFCQKKLTWKDMIYDLLISLIPVVAGIILLIIKFELFLLLGILILIALTTAGNAYVRGQLACKYCKHRELGCPAYELFEKK